MTLRRRWRDWRHRRLVRTGEHPRDRYLLAATGRDSAWWIDRLQWRISQTFEPGEDPRHPECDPWIAFSGIVWDVVDLCAETDAPPRPHDENMRVAAVLAIVTSIWASRISHAKCYDPERPVDLRRASLDSHARLVAVLHEAAADERRDADYFPSQAWNPPYGKSAHGGDFV